MTYDKIKPTWWRESSVYQIYPASFQDSNGDGFGDLQGIIDHVDYLKRLGVDMVWLSPINKSPQVDMGYDISDYKDIDPRYGSLKTVDTLIKSLNDNGMKFVLDLVVNHTSDQHAWFKESRSSRNNPKRDWYIWKPARYDENGERIPPTNWSSFFTESAWKWDETTEEYYLCLFADEQPDLNWENPDVRAAVHDIVRFWLDRGVSGFRLDVINLISKDQRFLDAPGPNKYNSGHMYFANGPRLHEYLQDMGKIFAEYDAFTVGEMPFVKDREEILKIVGADRGELNTIFQFDIVSLDGADGDKFSHRDWTLQDLKRAVDEFQESLPKQGGWNAVFIENHDQPRSISRFLHADSEEFRYTASKMLAMFVIFQCGTPFVYQGQELGMINIPASVPIEEYKDLESLNYWHRFLATNPSAEEKAAKAKQINLKARDNSRAPMHWTTDKNCGFSDAEPWMFTTSDVQCNAQAQVADKDSAYYFWADCLKVRKELKETVVYGEFKMVDFDHKQVVSWLRNGETEQLLVALNFTDKPVEYKLPVSVSEVVISNGKIAIENGIAKLGPFEGFVGRV
ncbi:oligo-1,6-glucosidase Ima5p [Trichomonascus vanleenenianus]|uniref:glycoside hydrolase family 13 protein n=1 Tax=Trichomonascus vanleenenianus TaxID=2268995 RepID=UPI003ECA90A5